MFVAVRVCLCSQVAARVWTAPVPSSEAYACAGAAAQLPSEVYACASQAAAIEVYACASQAVQLPMRG